ncbi:MAG: formimidoylglutamate deiminase [Acetobacteraceae bacterium]|nr:formimidoylglutamate deiminase [Acetobacteraceae bacterium]
MNTRPPSSQAFLAPWALLPKGWSRNVLIEVSECGTISSVTENASPSAAQALPGPVLPGMTSLHSHAFQYAMAGLAQAADPSGQDHFWSWREVMYRFLARLSPEDVEAIAAQLHVCLLKGGFTSVAEFHYLHADQDGNAYADPAEMSWRILAAARQSGIACSILPSLYRQGGFGQPPNDAQRRFVLPPERVLDIIAALRRATAADPLVRVGAAPHSLRAVAIGELSGFVTDVRRDDPLAPLHIHVAEQPREVADCLAATGRRPVSLLLEHVALDQGWCVIHATHIDRAEITALAASGAVVGLCPTTEADLGDGIFPFAEWCRAGGRFGIGTDSNLGTDAAGELRMLEYGQRLSRLRRAVAASASQPSTGTALWQQAAAHGARAASQPAGEIAPGRRADLVVLDGDHPMLAGRSGTTIADTLVFGPTPGIVRDVLVGGRPVISAGRHAEEEPIAARFAATLRRLLA